MVIYLSLFSVAAAAGGGGESAVPVSKPARLPDGVARFIEPRALCEHFLNEEPFDGERRAFLVRGIETHCRGTDSELARLRIKYRSDAGPHAALSPFEYPLGY